MIRLLTALVITACSPLAVSADAGDLLDTGKFAKRVKASGDQAPVVNAWVDSLRSAVGAHQFEYGRLMNEARSWQGFAPKLKTLRELEKKTRTRTDAFLDSIRAALTPKQTERLDRILKKHDLLDYPVTDVPFHRISTSPLSPKFKKRAKAYRVSIPGEPTEAAGWSYRELLETWTATTYVPIPEGTVNQTLVQSADVQVSASSPMLRTLIARSPILLSATLMPPDLSRREFDILYEHYPHTFESKASAAAAYTASQKSDENILVRLRMSTPYNEYYLNTDRYIIFLEDEEGTGYEPSLIDAAPVRGVETLEIRLPGQTVTYTDIFGRYTGQPGYKTTRTLRNPSKMQYSGRERLLKLFFPARTFDGRPIVTPKTRSLKLVVQPELENLPRLELTWDTSKKPKKRK